ncbi:rod shape-determining protein RodA [Ornithinimicrobium humiphilum]|uniref:peptidoglycan glycosyltransferase n=1 Tax=Ornithinimicrobium humiphilum TaxID=125288 RepID=A0A543KQ53_9MICO|nr:rod shape-determining protein RodA [Ornithinimicrobium humiphilum]TQM97188.1 rod shape determining protein RodA [Ornithinimicrobium humiphilum]
MLGTRTSLAPRPLRARYARTDWGLFVAAAGLSLMGALLVWSATHREVGAALAVRHLVNAAVGCAGAVALVAVDVRRLRAAAPWIYLAGVAGLVLVLTPVGQTVNGSRSWLFLPGGFSLQPAELAKIGLVIGLAMILAEGRDPLRPPRWRDVLLAWALAAVPVGLILLQPDLGSALVLGMLTVGVVAASGAAFRWTGAALLATVAAVVAAVRVPLLDPYQLDRLLAFRDPSLDPEGIGYQTRQVRLAIGSGGWSGTGLGEGPVTQGGFVPYQETDFVFSVVGEELGFLGASGLLLLLGFLVVRALLVALRCEDPFGRLVAVGVAAWFAFQVFENVGMNLGLMPVTGLPLPFLSYGGSSMLACWLAVGLLASAQQDRAGTWPGVVDLRGSGHPVQGRTRRRS